MHLVSQVAQHGQVEHQEEQPAGASSSRESDAREKSPIPDTPVVASPPTSPPTSPWWTAPGGKAVDIPDFGHVLFEALIAMLMPAPRPIPIRIRARR